MAEQFVLQGKYPDGSPKYFRQWTAIGPMATKSLDEAERFDSAQEAMQSPAYTHWSSDYEPTLHQPESQPRSTNNMPTQTKEKLKAALAKAKPEGE
jgi:hypothetical protein